MIEVMDEWGGSPEFLRIQDALLVKSQAQFIRRTFDESCDLYEHVWRQKARLLTDSFMETISSKLQSYASVKW